jgi:homoserine O-acetyltransferase
MKKNILQVENFPLECGVVLPKAEFFFTTYGTQKTYEHSSNAVLVFHALTGNAEPSEWLSGIVGENKIIDPKTDFVICANVLGSCYGSTGPESLDPETGKAYKKEFPQITIGDIANQHIAILDFLGIEKVSLGIGGSMGGMVLLALAAEKPDLFEKIIPISVGSSHSAWRIAFSSVIRKTIDAFGDTEAELLQGMHLARQIAMTSYRSAAEFNNRFGRDIHNEHFEVENYLEHQGDKIVARFSPHSYRTLTKAMELYDIADSIREIRSEALCIGSTSDILYSEEEIIDMAAQLISGRYRTLDAPFGHDSFLVAQDKLATLIAPFITAPVKQQEEVFA